MAPQKFSMNGALKFGWRTMKRHFWFFIGMFIITILLEMIPNALAGIVAEKVPILSLLMYLAAGIIGMIVGMGVFKIALKFCDHEPVKITDLFSCAPLFMKYLFGSILYGLIVCAGLILLIIPGVIWAVKFQFFSYCIIDKKLGPIEALKASSRMTSGVKWDLFVFGVVLMLINFVGFLCLGLGSLAPILAFFTTAYLIVQVGLLCVGLGLVLAMIPTTLVAYAFVYRSLQDPEYVATNEFAQIPTSGCLKWMAIIVVLGFFGIVILGMIAAIAIPNLLIAIQRSKVSRTKADMRAFGTALGAYHVDYNFYPQANTEELFRLLEKEYYAGSTRDGWGTDYIYIVDGKDDYRLISYGKDKRPGGSGFDADIIYANGMFMAPGDSTRDEELRSPAQEQAPLRKETMVPAPTSVPRLPTPMSAPTVTTILSPLAQDLDDCSGIYANGELIEFTSASDEEWSEGWRTWSWTAIALSKAKEEKASEALIYQIEEEIQKLWRFEVEERAVLYYAHVPREQAIEPGYCWKKVEELGKAVNIDADGVHKIENTMIYVFKTDVSLRLRSEPLTAFSFGEGIQLYMSPDLYIENDFEDQGDVVVDHATGLMWQKSGSDEELTYKAAQAYIERLNRKRFASYDDWRLPTVEELISLLEPEKQSNGLYINPIFDAKQSWCWSADTISSGSAWGVLFTSGNLDWLILQSHNYVRGVRSWSKNAP